MADLDYIQHVWDKKRKVWAIEPEGVLKEAVRLLRKREWNDVKWGLRCHICESWKCNGHDSDCEIGNFLAKFPEEVKA